jgi:hypothetical protein
MLSLSLRTHPSLPHLSCCSCAEDNAGVPASASSRTACDLSACGIAECTLLAGCSSTALALVGPRAFLVCVEGRSYWLFCRLVSWLGSCNPRGREWIGGWVVLWMVGWMVGWVVIAGRLLWVC